MMGISLEKVSLGQGEAINLSKTMSDAGGSLTKVMAGLGWDVRKTDGAKFDLDASAIGLDESGKAPDEHWFVFYGKDFTTSKDGNIVYGGDNQTGEGDGDDETVTIDLAALSAEIDRVVIVVSIFEGVKRGQNFGSVSNSYIRVVDVDSGQELADGKFDLREEAASMTALVYGEFYRYKGDWKFRVIGQGYKNGLADVMKDYGLVGDGG